MNKCECKWCEESIRADVLLEQQDYKSRCEKADEYIKEHQRKDEFLNLNEWQSRELLNILNGRSDE